MRRVLRQTLVALRRRPALVAGIFLSLSVGIGITTVVFGLVEATLWQPVPGLAEPERVVVVAGRVADSGLPTGYLSYLDARDLAAASDAFAHTALVSTFQANLAQGERIEVVQVAAVTPGYFAVARSHPSHGSVTWDPQEERALAVISHALWQRLFAGEREVLGRSLQLNGESFTLLGVAAEGFRGTDRVKPVDVWVPLRSHGRLASGPVAALTGGFGRQQEWLRLLGRLREDVSLARAREELQALDAQLAREYPETHGEERIAVTTARAMAFGPAGQERLERYLTLLAWVAGLTLLLAGANVASLLLARGLARRDELAIRLCLGAERSHLTRLLLVESLLLGLLGAGGGIILAATAFPIVERIQLPSQATLSAGLNWKVVGFAVLAALVISGLATVFPLLRLRKTAPLAGMRRAAGQALGVRGVRTSDLFVVAQMAIALTLLVGAGLFFRSLSNLEALDPGIDPDRLLAFDLDISFLEPSPPEARRFYGEILDGLERIPAVEEAVLVGGMPLLGGELVLRLSLSVDDGRVRDAQPGASYALVSPGYFETVGTPILRGRGFSEQDDAGAPPVVVLDETLVRQYGIEGDPVGTFVYLAQGEGPFEVVGVAAASTPDDLREQNKAVIYLPYPQSQASFVGQLLAASMTVVVRTTEAPGAVARDIRRTVQRADDRLPPVNLVPMEAKLKKASRLERQLTGLFSVLGGGAVLLALIGLYALMTQAVLHRRRELAIRMAVGASRPKVLHLVLLRGVGLSLAAVVLGLPLAWALGQLAADYLYAVPPADPPTFVLLAVGQTLFALLVAFLPAWRAARMDAAGVLREEG